MPLIPYSKFSKLRCKRFFPAGTEISAHGGFEWMNGIWKYEGVGFTWFGCLESDPNRTAGLEVYFDEVPPTTQRRLLRALGLPISSGMKITQLRQRLGIPDSTDVFASDRKTHNFVLGKRNAFRVSCTVHNRSGLVHVSMIRNDVFHELQAA